MNIFFFSFFRFRCSLQRLGSPFHLSVERCVESVWMHCRLIDCGSDRGRVNQYGCFAHCLWQRLWMLVFIPSLLVEIETRFFMSINRCEMC